MTDAEAVEQRLRLRAALATWSDGIQARAIEFVEGNRALLPRRITNAQLSGLASIADGASTFFEIRKFVSHQHEKAARAGRMDVQPYWAKLEKVLDGLPSQAAQLWTRASRTPPEADRLDDLQRRLAREFVQHVIAHSLFVGRRQAEDRRGGSRGGER